MIEFWHPADPSRRVRCQTHSRLGAPCVRYQDHGGAHHYASQSAVLARWAQTPSLQMPELSEGT